MKRAPMMLCLIHCGQTAWEHDHRMLGAADLPLSDSGRMAVAADVARMSAGKAGGGHIPTIHHPPTEAAADTAHLVAAHTRSRTKAVAELADPNLGLLEGLTIQDFADRFPTRHRQWEDDPLSLVPPEGEEIAAARVRLFKAVARILNRSRSHEVGIVLHTIGLGLLRCWLADRPARGMWELLKTRPRIERYVLGPQTAAALEHASS